MIIISDDFNVILKETVLFPPLVLYKDARLTAFSFICSIVRFLRNVLLCQSEQANFSQSINFIWELLLYFNGISRKPYGNLDQAISDDPRFPD